MVFFVEGCEGIEGTLLFHQLLTGHVVPDFKTGTLAPPALNKCRVAFHVCASTGFFENAAKRSGP